MRDISILKLNKTGLGLITIILFLIGKLHFDQKIDILDIIGNYYEFTIPLIFIVVNSVVYRVTVNSSGISKSLILPKIVYSKGNWSEIKHFIHVTEKVKDRNGKETSHEVIWFVDFNDKVCFRVSKQNPLSEGENMKKILSVVKQREVEYPEKLEFNNPYWYRTGIRKVDYTKKIKTDL